MRVIVTGSAGFVGSVLCCRAAEEGHEVLALDNLSRGLNRPWECPGVLFREADCRQGMKDAADGFRPDIVFHLAAGTGSLSRPIEELRELNVGMTERVFEDALSLGAQLVVFPTTSLALGVPDSPYVMSKEEGVAALRNHPNAGQALILRLFNVIGAYKGMTERRKNEVHILPTMLEAFEDGRPFVINGNDYEETVDGSPGRDFVHVLDVADYMLSLMMTVDELIKRAPDGAVWVGTGRLTTVCQSLRTFRQFIGPITEQEGPRRAFDCGALHCLPDQVERFARFRQPAPAWVGIRDELLALRSHPREVPHG